MRAEFSTTGLPPKQSAAVWREMVRSTFVSLDCASDGDAPLGGEIVRDVIGDFTVAQVASVGQKIHRTPGRIRDDTGDFVLANIQLTGTSFVEQDGRVAHLMPGDIALYESNRPYLLGFAKSYRQVVLRMPRSYMAAHFGDLRRFTALAIAKKDGATALASEYLTRLPTVLAGMDETSINRMMTIAFEFLAASLAEHAGGAIPQPSNSILAIARAKRYADGRLHDPDLSVPEIARAAGLSTRRMQDIFHEQGVTITGWMLDRRLLIAQRQLTNSAFSRVSIGTIASNCGFADQAHFSRCFRKKFGISPREARSIASE